MKKIVSIALFAALALSATAKEKAKKEEGFVFTTVKENPITSIKNQNRSSTCWSFSGAAFLESELLRKGKGTYDLSEMYIVHHTMIEQTSVFIHLRQCIQQIVCFKILLTQ